MQRYLLLFISIVLLNLPTAPAEAVPVFGSGAKKRPQVAQAKKSAPVKKKAAAASSSVSKKKTTAHSSASPKKRKPDTARQAAAKKKPAAVRRNVASRSKVAYAAPVEMGAVGGRITSKSVVILDARTGETLFAKEADKPRQPASTIKVLTGLIALKRLQAHESVEVSAHAESMPRSKIYLNARKQYKADDLINAVLLSSANDASVALAEKIAGSEEDFANLMTLHATLWGARNTVCRTASGLTAPGQQSTARDLAEIFRHAMQDREFSRRMRERQFSTSDGKTLRNHNKALWQVAGAVGGKTGYTSLARQTYVGKFERGGDSIVIAIMGSESMWRDIRWLVDYGFEKKEQVRMAQLARQQQAKASNVQ